MKKLATLEVWLDDTPGTESSHITEHPPGSFTLYLRPQADALYAETRPEVSLAHELGHFVAIVTKTPLGSESGMPFTDPFVQLEAEKEAWSLADIMLPGAGTSKEAKESIAAYEKWAMGK